MKKKLRLDMESLRVESFAATEDGGARGTVHGQSYTEPGWLSCDLTCGASPPLPSSIECRGSRSCPQECCL
jgi:hypothetical protein